MFHHFRDGASKLHQDACADGRRGETWTPGIPSGTDDHIFFWNGAKIIGSVATVPIDTRRELLFKSYQVRRSLWWPQRCCRSSSLWGHCWLPGRWYFFRHPVWALSNLRAYWGHVASCQTILYFDFFFFNPSALEIQSPQSNKHDPDKLHSAFFCPLACISIRGSEACVQTEKARAPGFDSLNRVQITTAGLANMSRHGSKRSLQQNTGTRVTLTL